MNNGTIPLMENRICVVLFLLINENYVYDKKEY